MNQIFRYTINIFLSGSFVAFVVPKCYDLRNLPVTTNTLLVNWTFHSETPQSLSGCYKLCSRYTACRSVNYMRDSLACDLNLRRKDDFPADVIRMNNVYYIDNGDLDQMFPSLCNTSHCGWNQLCVKSKCGEVRCVNHTECIYNVTLSSVLRMTSGYIQSINYPLNYSSNSEQEWVIIGPKGTYINLTFVAFQTEACCDYLTVRKGCNKLSSRLLKRSGNRLPGQLTIPHRSAWIHFKTDSSVVKSGFKIKYTII